MASGISLAEEILVEETQGVVIIGGSDTLKKREVYAVRGVQVKDNPFLEDAEEFLAELEAEFIGQPLTYDRLDEMRDEILQYYESKGRPLVIVNIPPQEITGGVVQVTVQEATVGKITFSGNRHFSTSRLKKYISVKPGDPIDTYKLANDLAAMNQNPFRRSDAIFTPGKRPGTTDIDIKTADRRTIRFYGGTDNTGTVETDRDRYFGGVNWANFLWLDHQAMYQFTMSPSFNKFRAQTMEYRMPIARNQNLLFFGNHTDVRPSNDIPTLYSRGRSWTTGGRYYLPLARGRKSHYLHQVIIGGDWKQTNNTLEFGGFLVEKNIAQIIQGTLGYNIGYKNKHLLLDINLNGYLSPGGLTPRNRTHVLEEFRAGAKARYFYGTGTFGAAVILNHWELHFDIYGQWANQNLFPTEQLGLGGFATVRGYEERQLNADMGAIGNFELRTPSILTKQDLYFIGFVDYGRGWFHKAEPGDPEHRTLLGAGAGVRYKLGRVLSIRFDYAYGFTKAGFINHRLHRPYFGVTLSI